MIEIENVTKIHRHGVRQIPALRGVSCRIPAGSFSFIFGPSGSGKSTLLYLMGALDTPTSGEVRIDGGRLSEFTARQRDEYRRFRVGFVFQSFNLLKNLTALDNVLVPSIPRGVSKADRRQAVDLLRRVGLGDRLDHRPHQLSGGEQQRVAIARAVLKKPKLLLADEPTGELDTQTGAELFGYLRQLHHEQQSTVVIVTHDQQYITDSDTCFFLRDGQLEKGPVTGAFR